MVPDSRAIPGGCTVYLMDEGLDTNRLAGRVVEASTADSVDELRRLVDEAQIDLLREVVEHAARRGQPPWREAQTRTTGGE